jgi:hypothetical protein
MKRSYFYLAVAILTFAVGTSFAIYFYSQKAVIQPVLQTETADTPSKQILQSENQNEKIDNLINFDDLTVKGIGLGRQSYEKDVRKAFGNPSFVRSTVFNCLGDVPAKTFAYNGLRLTLVYAPVDNFMVYEVEITSNKLQLDSGIKIGDDIQSVKQKIGKDFSERAEKGRIYLQFDNDDGWARFYFRNNRLEKVNWLYNYC